MKKARATWCLGLSFLLLLWVFCAAAAQAAADDHVQVYSLGADSWGSTLLAVRRPQTGMSSETFELVFSDGVRSGMVVSVSPSQGAIGVDVPSGNVELLPIAGGVLLTFHHVSGWGCSAIFDAEGRAVNSASFDCVEKGSHLVLGPTEELLDRLGLLGEEAGFLTRSGDETYVFSAQKSILPDWFTCIGGAVGWVASWGSVLGCATGIGCVAAVGVITTGGVIVADACASWANGSGNDGGDGGGDGNGSGDSGGGGDGGGSSGGSGSGGGSGGGA